MSNDGKHSEDDFLFGSTTGDDGSIDDSKSTSNDKNVINSKEDETGNVLDEPPNEKAKQQFVDSWTTKIKSGERTLEDLKAKQPWLLPLVEKQLDEKVSVDKDLVREVAKEEARKILEEERRNAQAEKDTEQFESLKQQLQSLSLSAEQKAIIGNKFESLKGKLSPYEALKLAADVAQVDYEDTEAKRRQFSSPKIGLGATNDDIDIEKVDPNKVSKEQRYKILSERRNRR